MEIILEYQSTSKHLLLKALLVFLYLCISNTQTLAAQLENSSCFIHDLSFDDAIIQIEQNGNYSTGVVIAKDRVITVAHALDESQKPMKILANIRGTHTSAQPLLIYKDTDLALLEVNTKNIRPGQQAIHTVMQEPSNRERFHRFKAKRSLAVRRFLPACQVVALSAAMKPAGATN